MDDLALKGVLSEMIVLIEELLVNQDIIFTKAGGNFSAADLLENAPSI